MLYMTMHVMACMHHDACNHVFMITHEITGFHDFTEKSVKLQFLQIFAKICEILQISRNLRLVNDFMKIINLSVS